MTDVQELPDTAAKELFRSLARDYHGGQWSQLYAVASSGKYRDRADLWREVREAEKVAEANGDTLDHRSWGVVIGWLLEVLPEEEE